MAGMLRRALLMIVALSGLAVVRPVAAQEAVLTIDLAQDHVDITTGFNGTDLSVHGVKNKPGDVVIVLRGPERDMVVRRKEQVFGMWMNRRAMTFRGVPSYYDMAASAPVQDIAAPDVLAQFGIGLQSMDFEFSGRTDSAEADTFREALVRSMQTEGGFMLKPRPVYFLNENFFRANFHLPANVPTGEYAVSAYLFKDGRIAGRREARLRVGQVGFNARTWIFAHENGAAYGLLAVIMAIVAGWSGYAFLRRE